MSLAARLMLLLLIATALVAGGWRAGVTSTDQRWRLQEAKAAKAAQRQLEAEITRGNTAVAEKIAADQAAATTYRQLEGAFHEITRRIPILASQRRPGGGLGVPAAVSGAADPVLSGAAVWMWNSALAGHDVPAGACGLADTSEAACAVATPITLDDAWLNHTINAKLCAEDRTNHQRLIDFINAQPREERAP